MISTMVVAGASGNTRGAKSGDIYTERSPLPSGVRANTPERVMPPLCTVSRSCVASGEG